MNNYSFEGHLKMNITTSIREADKQAAILVIIYVYVNIKPNWLSVLFWSATS